MNDHAHDDACQLEPPWSTEGSFPLALLLPFVSIFVRPV